MQRPLRHWFWRPLTLLIIPYASKRTYRVRLPTLVLVSFVAIWILGVGVSALLVTRHIHYKAMRLLNAHLTEQNARYAQDVARTEELAKRLVPLERELKRLMARTRRAAKDGVGDGGAYTEGYPHAPFLPEEIPRRADKLVEVGDEIFHDYKELVSLVACTPSGWPVRGWITSDYGERISPYTGEVGTMHQGIDIANKLGTPVTVTADGLILYAGWRSGGYGKMVQVSHGYGYSTIYAHCSRLKVSPGQRVRRGDVIGYVGSTGNATGPHCHYEVRLYGVPVSPRPFLK